MAGGDLKYRHLNRSSAHRQALLRNLVTSLFEHESITTTWPKAKEAQRLAEKLITLGKRNTNAARNKAQAVFYKPLEMMPKLFGEIRERYLDRPGGYTRVLHIEPQKQDQGASAILELVDGPRDMRFHMTAKAIARQKQQPGGVRELTEKNAAKVTRYRPDGKAELARMVERLRGLEVDAERTKRMGEWKQKVWTERTMRPDERWVEGRRKRMGLPSVNQR